MPRKTRLEVVEVPTPQSDLLSLAAREQIAAQVVEKTSNSEPVMGVVPYLSSISVPTIRWSGMIAWANKAGVKYATAAQWAEIFKAY